MDKLKLFIGGSWIDSEKTEYFEAFSPSTGEVIAEVTKGTRGDAQKAIKEARVASETFRKWGVWERAELLQNIANVVEDKQEELAHYLTLDQGKPFHTEAKREVDSVIRTFRETAEQIKWLESSVIPVKAPNKRVFTYYNPKGVYAVITPWNYPYMMPTEFIAPGLAAGNTIIWVPAPSTSVTAVKLMECFAEAGVPDGVINLITGMGNVVGDEIVSNEGTDAIAFCGSTVTGNIIAQRGAGKPLLIELGGNGPTIVFEDANIDQVAESIAKASFTNAGQICSATERIFVHESVHDLLAEKLTNIANNIVVGDPFKESTMMGPLNNEVVFAKNIEHANDSKEKGATFLLGGNKVDDVESGLYFMPTVVTNVTKDSLYYTEETFGPIAPLFTFSTTEELLEMFKENKWGLTASIFTNQINRAFTLAEEIPSGLVNINDNSDYWEPHIPFGGVSGKSSGIGRVGGKSAILEMSDVRTITIDVNDE
ncbi:aldehyde dehydrogenase family protein [Pseudogracilibacillus sp. SO30301A]|uniref:aldehyde dehydrogenase family protein n=1 Tax=Pseudogracilibacillus sp. SO30301A TaxID=3098291 RepID=UPI00300E1F9C